MRAGVSHQTVSRVINGDRRVLGATRERVLAAIRELDYEPNAVARSLSLNRTHTLGVVTYNVSDYAFGQTVAGAEAESRRRGYFLVVSSVADATADADEQAYLRLMLQRRVEGLILDWPTLRAENSHLLTMATSRVPLVAVAAHPDVAGIHVVDVDNRRGGFDATSFLISQGHRAIATITGPLAWSSAVARLEGYRDVLRAAGRVETPSLVQSCPDWGPASGQAATAHLLDSDATFTAIFAQSDLLAVGAMTELRARGLRVPEDVSIVGYDDIPVASFLDPPLSTMRQPLSELGARAAAIVVEAIGRRGSDQPAEPERHLLRASLVVRASVRPLPPSAGRAAEQR